MSQKLLQDQQQLLVKYKAREVRMMMTTMMMMTMMMMVMTMMVVEDGEELEKEKMRQRLLQDQQ